MDREIQWALEALRSDTVKAMAWQAIARSGGNAAAAEFLDELAAGWLAEARLLQDIVNANGLGEQLELLAESPAA